MSSDLWKKARLGDIADVVMGQSPKSEYYNNTGQGLPFLQGNRTFGYKHPVFDTYCTNGNKFANPDDVLLSVRAPVGDLNITKERVCIGRGLASICMKNGNNEYLYYLLKANIDELINRQSGTVYGSINRNDIINLEVLVVDSDEEQLGVSDILSTLDDKIELNRATNVTLEAIAQAIFKEWFVDFNYPGATGEMVQSPLGPIPAGWKSGILNDMVLISSGKFVKRNEFTDSGYPVIGANGKLGYSEAHNLDNEAIVTGRVGTLGTLQLINQKVWVTDNALVIEPKENFLFHYIYFWMRSIEFDNLNRGSTQPLITKTDLINQPIIEPSVSILKIFDESSRSLFNKIIKNKEENEILMKCRDLLIDELICRQYQCI